MTNAVNFVLESGISLALLSLIYILFLRKETFFRLNRVFILASLIFSIVLPFLIFRIYEPEPILLTEITVTPYRNLIEAVTVYGRDFSGTLEHVILSDNTIIYVYLGLVVFFLGRFLFRISRIFILIIKNPIENKGDYKLVVLNKEISPFSFLNYIFVGTNLKNTDGYPRMIAHEREHVKQGHSFDILIIEVLTALQWFNPFMWILKRVIRENHEFLADQAVIHSGVNFAQYKKLLLNQFVGGQLIITNNFNYSLIKTRIKMLSSIQSSRYAIVKLIFGIVIAMGLIIAFACEQKEMTELPLANQSESMKLSVIDGKLKIEGSFEELDKIKLLFSDNKQFEVGMDSLGNLELIKKKTANSEIQDEPVFSIVEQMPEFPGGEDAMRQFIGQTIQYPKVAVQGNINGRVYVSFVIASNGKVRNAKIARGVHPSLDEEALRVINSLPAWKPGKQRGTPVNVSYTVPIKFMLQ